MNTDTTILLIEDDDFAAELITELLQSHYRLQRISRKDSVFAALADYKPALLLLTLFDDKESALATCKQIRSKSESNDLPVIFVSNKFENDELLSVYNVGGDDYLSGTITYLELCSRIAHLLKIRTERNKLQADLSNAFSVAMSAMSNASEVGEILQFLRASFTCTDYLSICKQALTILNSFGLDARVQIRGQQETVSYSNLGECSAFEEAIFNSMSQQGRLISFSTHSACSYDHITLIVKNMPRDDAERHGRMLDNLALLCEAVNERVVALDNEIIIKQQKESFAHLANVINAALVDLNQQLMDSVKVALCDVKNAYQEQEAQLLAIPDHSAVQTTALKNILQKHALQGKLTALLAQVDFEPSNTVNQTDTP